MIDNFIDELTKYELIMNIKIIYTRLRNNIVHLSWYYISPIIVQVLDTVMYNVLNYTIV